MPVFRGTCNVLLLLLKQWALTAGSDCKTDMLKKAMRFFAMQKQAKSGPGTDQGAAQSHNFKQNLTRLQ